MAKPRDRLALDRASVRTKDADGHLHVSLTPISKANVCGYTGDEIMRQASNGSELNLNPQRLYKLYRNADALAKGADTSNGKPLLDTHVATSADNHRGDRVVGSVGRDAVFKFPYLYNSLSVWEGGAIDEIESEEKRELSSSYRYRANMTPGTIGGVAFDGEMLDIVFNHVALVEEGRAGPDVLVGDSKPMAISRSALMLQGALTGLLTPRLATDAKPDFAALAGVTRANLKAKRPALAAAFVAANKGKLAADEGIDVDEVVQIIEAVQGSTDPTDTDDLSPTPATDADDDVAAMVAKINALKPAAEDEDKPDDKGKDKDKDKPKGASDAKPGVTQVAMDAAITAATAKARKDALTEAAAIRNAERDVEPYVGALAVAMDSAEAVYKFALDTMEVDVKGVHPSAYPAMVKMLAKPDAEAGQKLASDSFTTSNDFRSRVPGAGRIRLA